MRENDLAMNAYSKRMTIMVRNRSWLIACCLCVSLLGCGGGEAPPPAAQNAAPPPAPDAARPGMGPPGMAGPASMPGGPGGMPGGPGAAVPAAPAVVVPKDPLIYLPANVTLAVGGLPGAVTKSPNKAGASFLSQFSPLTTALARVGLPPNQIESFWAAANADFSEQALCVITTADFNQEVLRLALGGDKIPKESRVWPLPGDANFALAVADSRTVIVGRKPTVESALRKSPALLIKQGLGTISQPDSDFWMAGDAVAAQTYFKGGLPLLGRYRQPFEELKAFGVGMILDGKPLGGNAAGGAPGQPGMAPGGPGAMAPGAGLPGGPGTPGTTSTVPVGDQFGVTVMGGLLFESDAAAAKAKLPLDQFLATSARHRIGGQTGRYMPDLAGTGGTGGPGGAGPGGPGAMPGGPGAMAPRGGPEGPRPGGPGGPGGPEGSNSQANLVSKVAVIPEPINAGATPPIDYRLQPVTPPAPQVVVATTPAANQPAAGTDPANPGPGAFPQGPGAIAGGPGASPLPGRPAEFAQPGAMGAGRMPGDMQGSGTWAYQQAGFVQFAYHFDARDENIAFAGHLLHALGASPFGNPLSAGPLSAMHKALQEARTPANTAGLVSGFGSQGTSWMVHLLPFMGHQALYKKLNPKWPLSHPENAKLNHAVIPEFLNPADPRLQWSGVPYADMGLTHFVGMSGVESEEGPLAATLDRNDPKAGIFGYNQIATPDQITDGLSSTIMMIGSGELASPWAVGGGATIRGARPNSFAPKTGFGSAGGPKAGAYVLFADGSVRFVSAEIDQQVFNAMSTTHGKDTVDLPALQGAGTVVGK